MSVLYLPEDESFSLTANVIRDTQGRFVKGHIPFYKTSITINCDHCGEIFERTPFHIRSSNYCSMACYKAASHSKIIRVKCKICGKKFVTCPSRVKSGRGKYCSRECYREALKGHEPSNKGKTLEEMVGKEKASKIRLRIATISEACWKKPAYVTKQMKARGARPNHQEQFMSKCFPCLQYVGDGSLIIGGKCPDFKVKGQRKLVELFGNYWHDTSEESQRISQFRKFGWDCLVVWDSTLKNDFAMVADKLNNFVGV